MRARITVTDIVYVLLALAALGALYPVFDDLLVSAASPWLAPEEELIFTSILPLAVLVILAVIYVEARS